MDIPIVLVLAGLMGAGGVVLAAVDAHAMPGAGLAGAAYMLLFHAAALVGGARALPAGRAVAAADARRSRRVDRRRHALLRRRGAARVCRASPVPMAAPSGGIILIAAWLGFAAAAVGALLRS
jgi:hypothetical protein